MPKNLELYHEVGDACAHIKTMFGTRFFVIKDTIDHYVGLFDYKFLDHPVMNNSEEDSEFNFMVMEKARGDVLIAGLGIGLIPFAVMNKESVTSVDVVEKYQEVIDMIQPQLPFNDKVKVIHSDILDFVPTGKYDVIIMDTVCARLQTEEDKLERMKDGKFITDADLLIDFEIYLKEGGEAFSYFT